MTMRWMPGGTTRAQYDAMLAEAREAARQSKETQENWIKARIAAREKEMG